MVNKSFVIYGERNSGTNFLETLITGQSYHLSHNIAAFNIPVINSSIEEYFRSDYGHKHFFGFHDEEIKTASNVIFIGIVRNPYDWIMGLSRTLHHIPTENHDIISFLTNEWYSIQHNKQSTNYQKEFFGDRDFCTGLRYKNIFAMRNKKLSYLHNTMPAIAENYELIRYEDLCQDPWSILTSWSDKYNLDLNMPIMMPIEKKPYEIQPEIKKIIDDNIDWEIENQVGYFKR